MADAVGLEPTTLILTRFRSTTELHVKIKLKLYCFNYNIETFASINTKNLVEDTGLEPVTSCL